MTPRVSCSSRLHKVMSDFGHISTLSVIPLVFIASFFELGATNLFIYFNASLRTAPKCSNKLKNTILNLPTTVVRFEVRNTIGPIPTQ